jgi:hypothetical protein
MPCNRIKGPPSFRIAHALSARIELSFAVNRG